MAQSAGCRSTGSLGRSTGLEPFHACTKRGFMTPRSPWITVAVFFGLFFGGGFAGDRLARLLAPSSALAEFVGFLVFPTAFAIGILAWVGASLPAAARRLMRLVRLRARPFSSDEKNPTGTIPPGSFAFVPVALVTCTLWGAVIAALSTELASGWVLCLYAALGLGYGLTCWKLAQTGFFGFPTE